MFIYKNSFISATFVLVWLSSYGWSQDRTISFNRDVKPILSNKCFLCHGPDESSREADLRLDNFDDATEYAIEAGNPDDSEFYLRITETDEEARMPPAEHGPALTAKEKTILRRWIESGAQYETHWSYVPPVRSDVAIADNDWCKNEIDVLTLAAMQTHGLQPSEAADRHSIIRRLALDLTGLPPTLEEADSLYQNETDSQYEEMVDHFLSQPSFGERWAAVWLDHARYADSKGYAEDHDREIWAYRDYVIRSFNDNKPFDQFTIEQIAGDLLDDPTQDQLIATAFHRNTLTNSEGGTIDEEFRSAAVVDRTNTTMAVWMGSTFACAQCHTHKYDPITQQEYFQLYAFFNSTSDNDQPDDSPVLPMYSAEQKREIAKIKAEIEELKNQIVQWENRPVEREQTENQTGRPEDAKTQMKAQIESLRQKIDGIQPSTQVPILQERPQQRDTYVHLRGSYLNRGELVQRGTPKALHPLDSENRDRLGLARWLVDSKNPLTARVIINRYWQHLFGIGIVATSEEFGSQGELPTHPKLLDLLACEFMNNGWDTKAILKKMVMSATYRQTSQTTKEKLAKDPDNLWLSRGPRFRLTAEMVRDHALRSSGLLSDKMYGPPVQPPQPKTGLKFAFRGVGADWQDSVGEDRYRRAIYTRWRRSSPYPSMTTFDISNREVCDLRRLRTNTPLQALVTLNDPAYVEAAQALARRVYGAGKKLDEQAIKMFRFVLIRPPRPQELELLLQLYHESVRHFEDAPDAAAKLAIDPLNPIAPDTDLVKLAAWTTVANSVLNLDEFFMKR